MVIFKFFKMAAAAMVNCKNFKFLTVEKIKKVEMHQYAKFRRNRSNQGQNIEIFRFFKMAAAAILKLSKF